MVLLIYTLCVLLPSFVVKSDTRKGTAYISEVLICTWFCEVDISASKKLAAANFLKVRQTEHVIICAFS